MADTILSGRWVVYYEAENRQKRIWRDTSVSPTTTDTVNALYSALQGHFDELGQMDDGVPMSAQTPTEYTIGIIDAGDTDPWFIDRTSIEYLTGGALKTASWDRVTSSNTGIVRFTYTTGTDFDTTDIGRDITNATGLDSGTLLDFNSTGATKYAWVRPDSNAAANDWDSTSGTVAVSNDSFAQVWQVDNTTFVDQSSGANDATNANWTVFPASEDTSDYVAMGYRQKFKKVIFDYANGTAGVGGTVTWQYWNGSTWAALSGVSDGTTGFTATVGDGKVLTFTVPSDWAATSLNGSQNLYYIRALVSGTYSTNPILDQGFIGGTGSVTQATAGASAGESLWANIYSIGTIEANTHLYIQQNGSNLTAYKASTDWWSDGHIDILVNVKELGTETDEGYIKVFARQYSKTYSYYTVDLTAGGRNPIPLQTGNDLDNQTGYKTIAFDNGTGTLAVGDVITVSATARAIVTAVTGAASATGTFDYYLIGDPITDLTNNEAFTSTTGKAADINGSSSNAGPAALGSPPSITFGGLTAGGTEDIDENGTAENYSITIDCNQNALADVYEYTKYITRRGNTGDIDAGSLTIEGQFYLGTEYRLKYTGSVTGTIVDGNTVTQETSGATGIVVNHNTTDKIIMLRNTRGTFATHASTHTLTDNTTGGTVEINSEATAVTPVGAAPFGTFAGGTFFVATGIVLTDYLTAEANNFQLKTDEGTVVEAPTKVTISVGNTRSGDKVGVFRLSGSGGSIIKDRYNATVQSALATTAVMGSSIAVDEPGRTAGGVIRLVDTSASAEYRIRFSSWASSTFTLASSDIASADSGTNTTTIVESGAFASSKVGDLVVNVTRGNAVSYITVITDSNTVTISPAITGQTTADNIKLNVLPVATTTSPQDTWYVPMIDTYETTGSAGTPGTETALITYLADIYVRVRARNAGNIIPYEADSTVTSTGMSNSIIRTTDTIFT
ncbi:MAG: hypothetical protein HZC02_01845 [Candidatus Levybacteria bacterium]|nr:hypothetical protein [Candidatus Levybacteria bacterium]